MVIKNLVMGPASTESTGMYPKKDVWIPYIHIQGQASCWHQVVAQVHVQDLCLTNVASHIWENNNTHQITSVFN